MRHLLVCYHSKDTGNEYRHVLFPLLKVITRLKHLKCSVIKIPVMLRDNLAHSHHSQFFF